MVGILQASITGFKEYRGRWSKGILYSILLSLVSLTNLLPFIGAIIYSYIYPKIIRMVAENWELVRGDLNFREAFKVALIIYGVPEILVWIVLWQMMDSLIALSSKISLESFQALLTNLIVVSIIGFILFMLFYSSFVDIVIGKDSKIRIDIVKSLKYLVVAIITSVIIAIPISLLMVLVSHHPVGTLIVTSLSTIFRVIPVLSVLYYAANQ